MALWLNDTEPSFLTKSTTISRVSGTEAYALPDDFDKVVRLEGESGYAIPYTSRGNKPTGTGFFVLGSNVHIIPDTVTETCTLYYAYIPADLSGGADVSDLPEACRFAVIMKAAAILKRRSEEDEARARLEEAYGLQLVTLMGRVTRQAQNPGRVRDVRGLTVLGDI